MTASPASWVAVDVNGNPVPPPACLNRRSRTPLELICFSVFGNRRLDTNGNIVPFTAADCPGGTAYSISPRRGLMACGTLRSDRRSRPVRSEVPATDAACQLLRRLDGLNLAQYAYPQSRGGTTNAANAQQITDPNANSKQINIKVDHNFNPSHKVAFNYTFQRDDNDGKRLLLARRTSGQVVRRPHVFTVNVTSTLSSQMVNEARFGMNRNYNRLRRVSQPGRGHRGCRRIPAAGRTERPESRLQVPGSCGQVIGTH